MTMLREVMRRYRIFVAALVLLLLLGLSALGIYLYRRDRGLPYRDSFARARSEEWKAFGGTWEVSDGSIRNDSDERGAKLVTGSTRWENYSIEADIKLLGVNGDAGIIARSSHEEEGVDAYDGYYAGLRTTDDALTIGRAGYGWMEVVFPLRPQGTTVDPSLWYHIKLLAYGCRLIASVAALPQGAPTVASITDENCIHSGRVGLRSYSSGGVWRNVVARAATQSDVDRMLLQGRPRKDAVQDFATEPPAPKVFLSPAHDRLSSPLPANPDTQPINSLRLSSLAIQQMATIQGSVILTSPSIFVQDSTGGVLVHPAHPISLKVGDEVEVTGQVKSNSLSSTLENATVRVLWEATPMPAVSVTASQAATGAFDATFIEVSGKLRHKEYGPDDVIIFDFDSGPQSFRAILNRGRGDYLYDRLKLNSVLRLRGVSVSDPKYTHSNTPFAVLVRSSDDIEVLAGPPWWSTGHLVAVVIVALLLALIINFLYHRIEGMQLRAVVEEREHIAYEMHDTLAQSVAGIGFQLEAIRTSVPGELPKVHRQLDLASELVRHSHAEARRSIDMLRPQQLESEGLLNALSHMAQRLVEGGIVQVISQTTGDQRSLPLRVTDTLYRIGQEALANAVRHAHPSMIAIKLEYLKHAVRLTIEDNGTGIDSEDDTHGLGILGMRKRANSISGKLEILGSGTGGTKVVVTAPLPPRLTLLTWSLVLRNLLRKCTRNVALSS